MSDGEIKAAFINLAQVMATQSQYITSQAQPMMAKTNREVTPRVNQNANTMDSHLRDLTGMNPPKFFGSKLYEDLHVFLMRFIRSFNLWG